MPYYINPRDGSLAYDLVLPPGAIQTSDPNMANPRLAPTASWYSLPGNGGRVYIQAGVPIPNAGTGSTMQWALPYNAIDDQGTPPPTPGDGVIHQGGATDAASWRLPGRGQFENQAWTGPSDWRGVPFAQMDTQGRPLSNYNNLVDQYQASRQPIQIGAPFARWAFGGGLLNQGGQQAPQTGQGGLLGQPSTPRVAVDYPQPQAPVFTPNAPTPAAPTPPMPSAPAPQAGTGLGMYGAPAINPLTGERDWTQTNPATNPIGAWQRAQYGAGFNPNQWGYDPSKPGPGAWALDATLQGYTGANPYVTIPGSK